VISRRRAILSYVSAFVLFLGAVACFVRFFGLAFYVGDAQFVPPGVCDRLCQQNLEEMDRQAGHWMLATVLLLCLASGLMFTGWRLRRTQARTGAVSLE